MSISIYIHIEIMVKHGVEVTFNTDEKILGVGEMMQPRGLSSNI